MSKTVLCSLQEAIGSGILSITISGKGYIHKVKHEKFCLVATQNPNKGAFKGKRQDLDIDFLSRYNKVNFEIDSIELHEISQGLAKEFGFIEENMDENKVKTRKKIIEDLVNFHIEWINNYLSDDDVQCFTIREISSTIKAIPNKNNSIFQCVYNIYVSRYKKNERKKLLNVLKKYQSLYSN